MDTPVSCRGSPSSANTPPGLSIPLPRVCFMGAFGGIRTRVHTRPQGRESNKDSRPVRSTTDSYEGIPAGGFEHHGSTGLACLPHWGMSTLTGVGGACPICRSDRTGLQPRELGESMADMKRVQTKSPRFEPSNPLTILRCTFDFVKSNRAAAPADARPKACTMAVPYRSHRPAEACHAYATSESYSHCTGTRIRAAAQHTPPP